MPVPGPMTLRVVLSTDDIPDGDIALSKWASVSSGIMLGRTTAGIGSIEQLTATQVKSLLTLEDADIVTIYNTGVPQVSGAERTAGTETALRTFSPADIASMAGTHGGAGTDHGTLSGLADDDHTQYLLADGTRTLSGNLTITGTVDGRDIAADGAALDALAGAEPNPDVVSQAEAEAGVATTERIWTAQRVAQAIAALGGGGGVTDHGALTGLADDDHTQYLLADGTRALTGDLNVGSFGIISTVGNIHLALPDAAGANKVVIEDSGAIEQAAIDSDGNLTLNGTVDGRDIATDGSKLDGISAGADVTSTVLGTVTGDVTFSGTVSSIAAGVVGTTEIADEAVTTAKLQHIPTARFLGRNTTGVGDVESLDMATARTLLNVEDGATADQSNAEIETAYNTQVAQVSAGEKTAGTETAVRRFSPKDVADMAGTHGGGGGGSDAATVSVKKASAGTINIGQVVYAAGYDAGVTVELADSDLDTTIPPIGVASASTTTSGGEVVTNGSVSGFDTSAFTRGKYVYLDTTAGGLTETRPNQPFVWRVGTVLYSHATAGIIEVNLEQVPGYYVDRLYVRSGSTLATHTEQCSDHIQHTGTVQKVVWASRSGIYNSDSSNYVTLDVQNVDNSNASFLANPYNTDTAVDGNLDIGENDLGTLNSTTANLAVTKGDRIQRVWTATGSPGNAGWTTSFIHLHIRPDN